ncbi:preQ(1) synthase [Tichowtungia aerotolerans]|uniref:NADPH-dependent 7-cyano-7-deazaguanine reductase n=1 Tax=Tichowtungia aerotolerans TaxID=2697043 RepID=A0A6P1MCW9_9BACT|nr:preQ(1) synthase [Tichowtungia aerotolerans]QHI69908.1 NADPH-dependent 7-cyano-7-deazaguanine reductase QueF [Tichowtungia aerotolerans]
MKSHTEGLTLLKKGEMNYPQAPDASILETFENSNPQRNYWIQFETDEFTSLCPITGQPDFARITIEYVPDQLCVESKSLKLFLFSFRNEGSFYEDVTNRIYTDLFGLLKPRHLIVTGDFTARGGIRSSVRVDSADA